VHFVVRLDAAGQYAENLIGFLHGLGARGADGSPGPLALSLSCGDPQRNKNYRAAVFGSKKSDPLEAHAAARFALTERPTADTPPPPRTPYPPPHRRPAPGGRPPTYAPHQPVPPLARLDLPRTGPAHQGRRRRLGP